MMTAPYTLGEGLVQTVAESGGNDAVNRLFRHPPTHESALLDPFRVLAGHTAATRVAVPKLQAGEKKFESGELGVLTWYVTLAQRLPLPQALAAADGWAVTRTSGTSTTAPTCLRAAYTGRTPADTARMYSALQGWRAAGASLGGDSQPRRRRRPVPVLRPRRRGRRRERRRPGRHHPGRGPGRARDRGHPVGRSAGDGALHGRQDGADLHRGPADRCDLRTGRRPSSPGSASSRSSAADRRTSVSGCVARRAGPRAACEPATFPHGLWALRSRRWSLGPWRPREHRGR